MKYSQAFIPTLRETPQDAETLSHRLMLRAGMIRKLASGAYTYLPLGLRALKKVEAVIRSEMNRAGAHEILMPALHPAELWRETGRWEIMGEDMFRFKDRHGRWNVLGPTHEEIITDLVRGEISSYRQLPVALYQIQTKFRDEMRPRSGVIRSREFIMKDAYSFHDTDESLGKTYEAMKEAYCRIFDRCGLKFYVVLADPGAMGGSGSQEFVMFSAAGEDRMIQKADGKTVVSAEMAARAVPPAAPNLAAAKAGALKKIATPDQSSISSLCRHLNKSPADMVKTLVFEQRGTGPSGEAPAGSGGKMIAVVVRGDREVSEYKVRKQFPGAAMASREAIERLGSAFGYSGPMNLKADFFLIDFEVAGMANFVMGANEDGAHWVDVNLGDWAGTLLASKTVWGDFRYACDGDPDPEITEGVLTLHTAIELGHIFKLNLRYSKPMKAQFKSVDGKDQPLIMGCYGIGVNRVLASAIEQGSSDKGILWPSIEVSPFEVLVLTTSSSDLQATEESRRLYIELTQQGFEVLWDDRELSAGVKFNDGELLGIPIQIVIGPKGLAKGEMEIRDLLNGSRSNLPVSQVLGWVGERVHALRKTG